MAPSNFVPPSILVDVECLSWLSRSISHDVDDIGWPRQHMSEQYAKLGAGITNITTPS